jgi:peptidyl-prolyl cis-trans isomerase SurA
MKGFRTSGSRWWGGRLLLLFLLATPDLRPLRAALVDRIAALVDQQVITLSEVSQLAEIRFFPHQAGQNEDDYRHSILESLIAQALRYRDVERFGAEDIPKDSIEARLLDIQKRFASPAEFTAAMQRAELTLDEVRALVKRQLQVEAYIQERFAPMIFISNDEIATYYRGAWSQQRRQRGLTIPPLTEVSEEIRTLLKSTRLQEEIEKWTTQLRARANVDVYAWR